MKLGGTLVTSTAAEINYLDITTLGTSQVSKAVTVDSDGDVIIPDGDKFEYGSSSDMILYHDGTNSYITNKTGALKLATETLGIAVTIGHTTSEVTVADNLTVTGNVTVAGGSAGAPSYTFDGDPDTGLFSSGSDVIGFSTNGSVKMVLQSDGDLHMQGNDVIGTSDIRFKELIHDDLSSDASGYIEGDKAVDLLSELNAITYVWNDQMYDYNNGSISTEVQYGLSAQEVMNVFGDNTNLVKVSNEGEITDSDGNVILDDNGEVISDTLGLNYTGFIPLLVESASELDQRLDAVEEELSGKHNLEVSTTDLTVSHIIEATGSFQTLDGEFDVYTITGGNNGDTLLLMSSTDEDWSIYDKVYLGDNQNVTTGNVKLSGDSHEFNSTGDSISLVYMGDVWYETDWTDIT